MNRMPDLFRISQDSAFRLSENHRRTAKTPRRRYLPRVLSVAGGIRVALHDKSEQSIAGFGLGDCDVIRGDELARIVTWNGHADLSHLAGEPVRRRFELKDANVFSFRFAQ